MKGIKNNKRNNKKFVDLPTEFLKNSNTSNKTYK